MKKPIILAIVMVLILIAAAPVFARSTYYYAGDTMFSIRAGVDFPAFISFYKDAGRGTVFFNDTHLKLGGTASLAYQGFLSEYIAIGGELGYMFNYSRSGLLLTTVPIMVKFTWFPVQTGRFDLGVGLNLGGAFIRYNEGKYFAPAASVTLNPTYYINENWGIGVETGLLMTLESYSNKNSKNMASALAGLMPVALTLSYRH